MKSSLFSIFPTIAPSLTLAARGQSPAPSAVPEVMVLTGLPPGGQQTIALTFSAS